MSANSYFADVADVDWSKVGEYEKTGWFLPLNKYFSPSSLKLGHAAARHVRLGQQAHGHAVRLVVPGHHRQHQGLLEGWRHRQFPTTLAAFSAALKKVGKANGMANPLDIHFATAEGLSTCWYQMTAAFGGRF